MFAGNLAFGYLAGPSVVIYSGTLHSNMGGDLAKTGMAQTGRLCMAIEETEDLSCAHSQM